MKKSLAVVALVLSLAIGSQAGVIRSVAKGTKKTMVIAKKDVKKAAKATWKFIY